jgi:large subunit ribosomal protein L4
MPTVKKKPIKKAAVKKIALKTKTPKKEAKELVKETGLKLSVYNTKGKVVESLTLPKDIFAVEVNNKLMAQAVRVYMANKRRGTVKTKSRGEVNISTRKIYRQKGTGRARHGAASAPIFVGGGIAFGPRQRDYSLKLTQDMKRKALFSALSSKLKKGEIRLVSGLEKLEPKTKLMNETFESLSLNGKKLKVLLVTPKPGKDFENVTKAARNIEGVRISSSNLLNAYDVLQSQNILFMKQSLDTVKETFLKDK